MPTADETVSLEPQGADATQAEIDKLRAILDSTQNESNRKFLRGRIRELETRLQKENEAAIHDQQSDAADFLDPQDARTAEEQALYEQSIGLVDPSQLQQYGSDSMREVGANELIEAQTGGTAWDGAQSAFDALGGSAYGELGPSAFEGLQLSPEQLAAMGESRDYYGALMRGDGRDAISEAEYRGRVADAEQVRRASTEAALEAEEARGSSSAGGRILAEQVASQAQVGDMHRAGLDASALAQKRRDAAAGSYYDASRGIAQDQFGADAQRAGGLDAFGQNQAAGLDAYGTRVASGQDAFDASRYGAMDQTQQYYDALAQDAAQYNAGQYSGAADMNQQRGWYTQDLNTDVANQTTQGNAQARANATGTYLSALGMEGSQTLGQGAQSLNREQFDFQRSQAPSSFERAFQTYAAPLAGAGAGLFGQLTRDDDDDD